jgi:hypothetical protein
MSGKVMLAILIPKLCMFALAKFVKVFNLKIGTVADKIGRFYAIKLSKKLPFNLRSFGAL